MMQVQCGICNGALSKYKCPLCRLPYCSLPCFKVHKAAPPCVAKPPPADDQQPPPARDFDTGDGGEPSLRLRRQQLEAVAESPEIRAMLKDQLLQETVKKIDSSGTAETDLDTAMNLPAFKEFAEKILDIVAASSKR